MFKYDIFEPDIAFTLEEANGEVDGQHVLGKVAGTFFVPNGISRNNRFYPRELWEKVVQDEGVRKRLSEKRMFGTIGHNQQLNDDALREGKISHIVTNLSIQGDRGVGEALILDTPAGKVLNTLLRAGSKLFVSSRADGDYDGEEKGIPKVNPQTYVLNTFDMVIDPGFLQANPKLVESIQEELSQLQTTNTKTNEQGDHIMSQQVIEQLAKENGSLKADLERAVKDIETLKNESIVLADENKHLLSKVDKAENTLKEYRELGSVSEIKSFFDKAEKDIKEWRDSVAGSPVEAVKGIEKALNLIKEYKERGTPRELDKVFERMNMTLAWFRKNGSMGEINKLLSVVEKNNSQVNRLKVEKRIQSLAKQYGLKEEVVKKVYGKMSEKELTDFLSSIAQQTSKVVESHKATTPWIKNENKTTSTNKVNTESKSSLFGNSLGERLMESMSR